MIDSFIKELKVFDWEYDSSDDFSVWKTNRAKHRELDKRYRALTADEKEKVVSALGWADRLSRFPKYHIDDAVSFRVMRSFSE